MCLASFTQHNILKVHVVSTSCCYYFLCLSNIPLLAYTGFWLSIDQQMNIWVFFYSLDIMNSVIYVQVLVCVYIFIFLEYIPKSGIAELNGNFLFNHLRSCQAVFHSTVTVWQQCMRIPVSPHTCQHCYYLTF